MRKYNKIRSLKHHGMTPDDYENMLQDQQGACAICAAPNGTGESKQSPRLSIDHCHITKKVRGLLCRNCNLGLGHFKDKAALLKKAFDYLVGPA
jgi:hypothetical protein